MRPNVCTRERRRFRRAVAVDRQSNEVGHALVDWFWDPEPVGGHGKTAVLHIDVDCIVDHVRVEQDPLSDLYFFVEINRRMASGTYLEIDYGDGYPSQE